MAEPDGTTDWAAIERLVRPLYNASPLHDWSVACRLTRHIDFLSEGCVPFDQEKAKLLCWFHVIRDRAADPAERRHWTRPLRAAGVPLTTQTWLWIALERYMKAPVTDEERVVHDAVALDRVGAVGVARAFTKGGQTGRPLRDSAEELKKQISEAVFLTPAGRRLGVRRIVYTRRFLKEMEEE